MGTQFRITGGKNHMQRDTTTMPAVQTVKDLGDMAAELGVSAASLLGERGPRPAPSES